MVKIKKYATSVFIVTILNQDFRTPFSYNLTDIYCGGTISWHMLSKYLKPVNEITIKNLFWGIFGKTRGSFQQEVFKITPCGCKEPKKEILTNKPS